MTLRACLQCRRHFAAEPSCPFCGAPASSPQPRALVAGHLSRAAIFAGLAGCYTSNPPPQYGPPPPPPEQQDQQQQQQFANPPPDDTKAVSGTSRIEGTVTVGQAGAPMAQLEVQLHRTGGPSQPARTTLTDSYGRYVFDGLAAGTYDVKFGYPDPRHVTTQRTVQLGNADARTADVHINTAPPPPHHLPTPYGAPPFRRRVV